MGKIALWISCILFFFLFPAKGISQKIHVERGIFKSTYMKGDLRMDHRLFINELYLKNKEAYHVAKQIKTARALSWPLGIAGGWILGDQAHKLFTDRNVSGPTMGISIALIISGSIIKIRANKAERKAIDLYNQGIDEGLYTNYDLPRINWISENGRHGLVLSF